MIDTSKLGKDSVAYLVRVATFTDLTSDDMKVLSANSMTEFNLRNYIVEKVFPWEVIKNLVTNKESISLSKNIDDSTNTNRMVDPSELFLYQHEAELECDIRNRKLMEDIDLLCDVLKKSKINACRSIKSKSKREDRIAYEEG